MQFNLRLTSVDFFLQWWNSKGLWGNYLYWTLVTSSFMFNLFYYRFLKFMIAADLFFILLVLLSRTSQIGREPKFVSSSFKMRLKQFDANHFGTFWEILFLKNIIIKTAGCWRKDLGNGNYIDITVNIEDTKDLFFSNTSCTTKFCQLRVNLKQPNSCFLFNRVV